MKNGSRSPRFIQRKMPLSESHVRLIA
jgi:hypothetical protein